MESFYDPRTIGMPTYPIGSGSIDERIARLEMHCWHERQARLASERLTHREMEAQRRDRAALILKVGFWAISGLCAALWALVSTILTGGFHVAG